MLVEKKSKNIINPQINIPGEKKTNWRITILIHLKITAIALLHVNINSIFLLITTFSKTKNRSGGIVLHVFLISFMSHLAVDS